MSWNDYITNLNGAGLKKAALYSKAGDSVWAISPDFSPSAAEIQELSKGFDDSSSIQANGIHIEGAKYFVIRSDDRSVYGKLDNTGIIAVRTKQALLVAYYDENMQPGDASKNVEKMADHLISSGF